MSAPVSAVAAGTRLIADARFTCLTEGEVVVQADRGGRLYVPCRCGQHFLDGQTEDGVTLIGLALADTMPPALSADLTSNQQTET